MSKTVTREDVARLANVSPTIVSYVLNNSNYVSQEKREKVLEAVRELNYIPNQLARGLRTSRSTIFRQNFLRQWRPGFLSMDTIYPLITAGIPRSSWIC